MTNQDSSTANPERLFRISGAVIIQQALYAAAKLGMADLLNGGPRNTAELADQLGVNEGALYRVMRLLASEGIFEETLPRTFANTGVCYFLRTGVPGSIRSILIFRGSEFSFAPFGEILYSIETGLPAREKLYGMNVFEHLQQHPEMARIFDDAMTNMSQLIGPAIARAYDFGAWDSLIDVGGGNGILLAAILDAHPGLRGVLADVPHVIARARQNGLLSGALEPRSEMRSCDFFREVPSGCRAYLLKSVIHDWDDERAHKILVNCRRAVAADGVLLLVELGTPEGDLPIPGKLTDVAMLVLTGGRERTLVEYRELLAAAGFHLNQVLPVPGPSGFSIIESLPV